MTYSWTHVRLADCVDLLVGYPFKSKYYVEHGQGVRLLRGDNIGQGYLCWDDAKEWPRHFLDGLERYWLVEGDVVLAMDRPWIPAGLKYARIRSSDVPCLLVQRVACLRARPGVDPRFLYYLIGSPDFTDYVLSVQTGTAVPHISARQILDFSFKLPPLELQQRIGWLLGSLDDRSYCLQVINRTLDEMASTVFKSWFINFDPVRAKAESREPEGMDSETAALFPDDFQDSAIGMIPRGWRCATFGELAEPHMHSVKPSLHPNTVFEHYSIPAYDSGQLPRLEPGAAIKSNKTVVPPGCVLQSKLNPHIPRIWLPGRVGSNAICSTEFVPWVPRPHVPVEYLYCLLKSSLFTAILQSLATGTSNSHQRVRPEQIFVLPVLVPPPTVMAAFQACVAPLLERVVHNRYQVQTLASLRDTLLPRLISGKLRIPEAEEALKEVL